MAIHMMAISRYTVKENNQIGLPVFFKITQNVDHDRQTDEKIKIII